MNEYMVMYVDYKTDKTMSIYVESSSEQEAIKKTQRLVNYWRIIDVVLVRENVK